MEAGEKHAARDRPVTVRLRTTNASQLSLPDRLRGQHFRNRTGAIPQRPEASNPRRDAAEPPCGSPQDNGPTHRAPGDRREVLAQETARASARTATTGNPTLRRKATGDQQRKREDLEGETSPWETRAVDCWQRQYAATDSSVEQGLEDGLSPGGRPPLVPGNGSLGRTPRTPARERVRTTRLRSRRPAPFESWTTSVMWGSASADRSLTKTRTRSSRLRSHLGGTRARFGLGCRTATSVALFGSGRRNRPACRRCRPVPVDPPASAARNQRPAGPSMPASVGTAYPPGKTGPASAGTGIPRIPDPASAGPPEIQPLPPRFMLRHAAR
jgi:hypothetical protein